MITSQIEASGIPANVFNGFRVVGPKDKLLLYANIEKMPWWTIDEIKQVSIKLARSNAKKFVLEWFSSYSQSDISHCAGRKA